ncbi:hypothetical protein, conserved [Plasmodium ovale]|uniref:Uncharacterized protein n=1 Tax=Plasmodium ovale TaxID=36330 RepID=A0A1C3KH42_PLAOA|nr:hypothetical protein, conserved [Plasmodium ovale]
MTFFQNDFNKNLSKKIDLNRPLGLRTVRLLLQESSLEYGSQNGPLRENALHKSADTLSCMDCFDHTKKKLQTIYSKIDNDLWGSSTEIDKNMDKGLNTKSNDNKNMCKEVAKVAFLMILLNTIGIIGTTGYYLSRKAHGQLKKKQK